jgi:multiple sugar transport system permease protein
MFKKSALRWSVFVPYLLVLPAVIILCGVVLYPMIDSIRLSTTSTIIGMPTKFVGFGNYTRAMADREFWNSFGVTFKYWFFSVSLQLSLGLVLALIVNGLKRGRKLFSTIVYIPIVTTPVVVAISWRWLYNPDFGLINIILGRWIENLPIWLGKTTTALPAIIVTDIWHQTGFSFLILFTALQYIPKELTDAATVDGASPLQQIFRIIIPSILPSIAVVLTLRTIDSFRLFDKIFVMT